MKLKNFKHYCQKSEAWENNWLGFSKLRFSDYGCLLCAYASTLAYFGKDINPATLNEVLKRAKAFNGALITGRKFANQFNFKFHGLEEYENNPAPIDLIKDRLKKGWPTIIRVDYNPQTVKRDDHFVTVIGDTAKDLIISDSLFGEERYLCETYPHRIKKYNLPKYVVKGLRRLDPQWNWKGGSSSQTGASDDLTACLEGHSSAMEGLYESERREKQLQTKLDLAVKVKAKIALSNNDLIKENEAWKSKVEGIEKKNKELKESLKTCKTEKLKLAKRNDQLSAKNTSLNGNLTLKHLELKTANKAVANLRLKLNSAETQSKKWKDLAQVKIDEASWKQLLTLLIGKFLKTN